MINDCSYCRETVRHCVPPDRRTLHHQWSSIAKKNWLWVYSKFNIQLPIYSSTRDKESVKCHQRDVIYKIKGGETLPDTPPSFFYKSLERKKFKKRAMEGKPIDYQGPKRHNSQSQCMNFIWILIQVNKLNSRNF